MPGLWSVALKAALDAFSAIGLNTARICEDAGVPRAAIDDPHARIPLDVTARIWPAAARQWGRPGLGLWAGGAVAFGRLEALDYAFATATTVGEGLYRVARYWHLVTGGATGLHVLAPRGGTVALELRGYGLPDLRDYAVATTTLRLANVGAAPVLVTISGPPAADEREYAARLGCDVRLGAQRTAVHVRTETLAQPLPQRFPGLRAVVDRELERQLSAAKKRVDPLADIRREVTSLMGPEAPALAEVAARLGCSVRQLQRRLTQHRSSFTDVLTEARRALAEAYLERGTLAVAEIAYLLGYSEPSAFSRAFKRWTGVAPERRRDLAQTRRKR